MQLSELNIEYRAGLVFSIIALVLSLTTGLVAGISITVIIVRSFIMVPVFFGVGYSVTLILKKFVPEIYELFTVKKDEKTETAAEVIDISQDNEEVNAGVLSESSEQQDTGFTELTEKNFDRYNTVSDSGLETTLNTSTGKLGKHIIVQEQFNNYEPKIMAQAVRTMMNKEKD